MCVCKCVCVCVCVCERTRVVENASRQVLPLMRKISSALSRSWVQRL